MYTILFLAEWLSGLIEQTPSKMDLYLYETESEMPHFNRQIRTNVQYSPV